MIARRRHSSGSRRPSLPIGLRCSEVTKPGCLQQYRPRAETTCGWEGNRGPGGEYWQQPPKCALVYTTNATRVADCLPRNWRSTLAFTVLTDCGTTFTFRLGLLCSAVGPLVCRVQMAEPIKMPVGGADSCWHKEPCIRLEGCTLAPHGEYD